MNISQTKLYRILLPKFIRKKLDASRLKAKIFDHYANHPESLTEEIRQAIDYLKHRPVVMFPHHFQDQYHHEEVRVFFDKERKLPFVMLENKRLYFKRRLGKKRIQKIFNELLKEQDPLSPHCYEKEGFKVGKDDVVADVGAAEGNFSLSIVESAARIILFEGDKEWLEPLEATFSPWKDKVTIVPKFVGDSVDQNYTTLDDYFTSDDKLSFLKIDVEGAESSLLKGSKKILQSNLPLKVAICTYHKAEDEHEFTQQLSGLGFQTTTSGGYVLLFRDRKNKAPYFRRGLIRAIRL